MTNVIEFNRKRTFSKTEVQSLLPIVLRITRQYHSRVQTLLRNLEVVQDRNQSVASNLEREINDLVHDWQTKMEKLGGHTKGLWIADFDSGEGYYCWKFPEERIEFWHRYSDGFSGRKRIDPVVQVVEPVVSEPLSNRSPDSLR